MIVLTIVLSFIHLISTSTVCFSSGHWLLTSLPSSFLLPLLPPSSLLIPPPPSFLHSSSPSFSSSSSPTSSSASSSSSSYSHHPVLIKFDKQESCYSFGVIPSPNMKEFKLEIPFVEIKGKIYTFKLVFVDNWLNALGGKWVYGISMNYCQFSGDFFNDYELICDKEKITGNFNKSDIINFDDSINKSDKDVINTSNAEDSYKKQGLINVESLPNFKETFLYLNQAPWLANTVNFDNENIYCAYNIYDWEEAKGKNVYIKGNLDIMGQTFQIEGIGIYLESQLQINDKERC